MLPSRISFVPTLLAIVLLTSCAKKTAQNSGANAETVQPVEVTSLVRRDLAETLAVVGSIAANESATLRPEIAGIVRSISFDEGQTVKAGQVLAKLDDAELQAQFRQGEARFQLANLNLQRAVTLRETQSTTQVELDRAKTEFASAEADLALLKVRLERTTIHAPYDGLVGARRISPGDYVNTQSVITTIDDLSRLKIEFQVPERFFAKVVPGTKFVVTSRSSGNTGRPDAKIPGEVYFASSAIDRTTRSSEVKGYLSNAPAGLKPGMFANVELVLSVKTGALTVTEGAILTTPRGTQIIAVRDQGADKTADFVNVKIGLRSKGLVEIEPLGAKLEDNQQVVASGVGALILFPGAKLEPRPQKEQFRVGLDN
jgi:membrane fusion protein (multidrug efflux system)